jgi:hypothetical protein
MIRARLRYAWSWCESELVGLTVCKVIGHRRPEPEVVRFGNRLADAFGLPQSSAAREMDVCIRCGSDLEGA